jgi:hypothetical protein
MEEKLSVDRFWMETAVACAGIFKQSMGARNREGIGLSYVPARQTTQPGRIGSLEWILGLHKSVKIRALVSTCVKVSLGVAFYDVLAVESRQERVYCTVNLCLAGIKYKTRYWTYITVPRKF